MRRFGWTGFLLVGLAAGCKDGAKNYTPSETNARAALETALTQWRDGQARPAPFPLGKVTVQVADQNWEAGQKLLGFEIVGDDGATSGPRAFTVKLKTAKGEQTTKYYVFGIDPLQVFSEPDYRKLTGG
jgi:hypothetical protein